jgi:hypothetical protein
MNMAQSIQMLKSYLTVSPPAKIGDGQTIRTLAGNSVQLRGTEDARYSATYCNAIDTFLANTLATGARI